MSKNKNYPFDSDCNDVYQSTINVTEVKITTDPENKIEIAGWIDASCDDGPGIRSVLFFQGCSKNCPGCHNAKTHKRGEGSWYAVDELARKTSAGCHSKMITISGGEPLEQESGLVQVLYELHLFHCQHLVPPFGFNYRKYSTADTSFDLLIIGDRCKKLLTGSCKNLLTSLCKKLVTAACKILLTAGCKKLLTRM